MHRCSIFLTSLFLTGCAHEPIVFRVTDHFELSSLYAEPTLIAWVIGTVGWITSFVTFGITRRSPVALMVWGMFMCGESVTGQAIWGQINPHVSLGMLLIMTMSAVATMASAYGGLAIFMHPGEKDAMRDAVIRGSPGWITGLIL